jgi:hypothetical protein
VKFECCLSIGSPKAGACVVNIACILFPSRFVCVGNEAEKDRMELSGPGRGQSAFHLEEIAMMSMCFPKCSVGIRTCRSSGKTIPLVGMARLVQSCQERINRRSLSTVPSIQQPGEIQDDTFLSVHGDDVLLLNSVPDG